MSNQCHGRALKLRAVALEFRALAARSTDDFFCRRMLTTAAELEAFADTLAPNAPAEDVVWDDSSLPVPDCA